MLCKVCGAQIPDDAVKCEFCGATMENGEVTEEAIDETKVIDAEELKNIEEQETEKDAKEEIFDDNERRRREQMQRMQENKKKQLSEIERRRNEKRIKQKRNRIALIALICALAVAAAGYGAYYLVQNINTENNVAPTPTPAATIGLVTPTPSVEPTPTQSPTLNMTPAPNNTNAQAQSSQSWSATGSSSSSSGSANRGTASSSSASSHSSSSGGSSGSSGSSSSSGGSSGGSLSGSVSSVVANAKASGVSNANIASQLSVGGEVIYNSGTGKYLMTFVTGNVKYYANVSPGSTTEQIQYKPYTITAAPTGETYNGNTVYEISSMTNYAGNDYVLENSGTRLLTSSDIKGMSKHDLALARNEIFARHGRKFQTAVYRDFFNSKSWYKINPNYNYSDDNSNLNSIEIKNVQFLLNAERK